MRKEWKLLFGCDRGDSLEILGDVPIGEISADWIDESFRKWDMGIFNIKDDPEDRQYDGVNTLVTYSKRKCIYGRIIDPSLQSLPLPTIYPFLVFQCTRSAVKLDCNIVKASGRVN